MGDREIVIDGLIFELQSVGGISRVWANLLASFIAAGRDFVYIEDPVAAKSNVYRSQFVVPKEKIRVVSRNARLAKYLTLGERGKLVVPSYYKYVPNSASSIQVCHDVMPEQILSGVRGKMVRFGRQHIYDRAKTVVCISESTRRGFIEYYPEFEDKARLIYNPVDFNELDLYLNNRKGEEEANQLLSCVYVGNRQGYKNFWEIEHLIKVEPEIVINVVGGWPSDYENNRISANGLERNVIFHGPLPNSSMYEVMQRSSFLFFPSISEGFGLPVVEALYLGIPVVGRNVSVNDEISRGWMHVYDQPDPVLIGKAVHSAIAERKSGKLHEAKKQLLIYDAKTVADQYWNVIESA